LFIHWIKKLINYSVFSLKTLGYACLLYIAFKTNLKQIFGIISLFTFLFVWGGVGCVQTTNDYLPEPTLGNGDLLPTPEIVKPEIIINPHRTRGGLAFSGNGDLYIANFKKDGAIAKLNKKSFKNPEVFIDLTEWISSIGEFPASASGLCFDKKGRLLVVDAGTGKLLRISSKANKLEVLADSYDGYRFESVEDLAIAPNGDLFVSSPLSGTIYRIRPDIGYVGVLNDDLVRVVGLAISPDGKQLIATEPDASRVVVYDIPKDLILADSWTLVDFSPSGIEPRSAAFDDRGRLYLGLGNLNEIRVFDLELGVEIERYSVDTEADSVVYHKGSIYVGGNDKVIRLRLRD
jgi:sugar lactone lactonase YvrE